MILSGIAGMLLGCLIIVIVGKILLSRQENMFQKEIDRYKSSHTINGQWAGDYTKKYKDPQ